MSIIERIRQILISPKLIQDIQYYQKDEIISILENQDTMDPINNNLPSYLFGKNFKRYVYDVINSGDIFLAFSLTTDGISVFNKAVTEQNISCNPILVKLLNYKNSRKYDTRRFWTYTCVEERHINVMLQIVVEEFRLLYEGIDMDVVINGNIEKKRVIGVLLDVFGDTCAISKIGGFMGPASTYPCRFCNMKCDRHKISFHEGIKSSYQTIKNYIISTENTINIYYPCTNNHMYENRSLIRDNHDDISILYDCFIKSSKLYDNCFNNTSYHVYDKEDYEKIRHLNPKIPSKESIKVKASPFELLSYFDPSSSFSIDIMHLFENVTDLLLCLLFNFCSEKYIANLSKKRSQKQSLELLGKIALSKENISILEERIKWINSFYNDCEYQFRYILDEIKFRKLTAHTKIYFISKIFPIISYDFSYTDSMIIPLIDIFAVIVHDANVLTSNDTEELELLKTKCFIFTFLSDLVLPNELINSQVHTIQHLSSCIINSGSLSISSTWESESYYSKVKHITQSRNEFNTSCSLAFYIHESIKLASINQQRENTNDINELHFGRVIIQEPLLNTYTTNYLPFSEIRINKKYNCKPNVTRVCGKKRLDNKQLTPDDTYNLLYLLINEDSQRINSILFYDINIDELTFQQRIDLLNDKFIYENVINRMKNIIPFFYSQILVNDRIVFSISEIDQGVERIDNSYLMYFDNNDRFTPHLIKSLYYIQIEDRMFISCYDYQESSPSTTNLYYFFNSSIERRSHNKQLISTQYRIGYNRFMPVWKFLASNIIVCDVNIAGVKDLAQYRKKVHDKKKRSNSKVKTVSETEVITYTVYIPRDNIKNNGLLSKQ
ncbi:hypothetical protein WA158_005713 [Blastocystis sp. Blastoise]